MLLLSLATIYHSKLATDNLRKRILKDLRDHGILGENEEPPKPLVMRPIKEIPIKEWMDIVEGNSETLLRFEL